MGIKNAADISTETIEPGDIYPAGDVVAVVGWGDDWAAYRAREQGWSAEYIARQGDKLSANEAKALFPKLARIRHYRD